MCIRDRSSVGRTGSGTSIRSVSYTHLALFEREDLDSAHSRCKLGDGSSYCGSGLGALVGDRQHQVLAILIHCFAPLTSCVVEPSLQVDQFGHKLGTSPHSETHPTGPLDQGLGFGQLLAAQCLAGVVDQLLGQGSQQDVYKRQDVLRACRRDEHLARHSPQKIKQVSVALGV